MKRSSSLQDIPRFLSNYVSPAGLFVSITANSISHIMKSTKGKERMLAFVQYSAELFKITMTDHLESHRKRAYPLSLKNAKNIEKSMKNGRKLMRVLMFLDELSAIEKLLKTYRFWDIVSVLQLLSNVAGTVFYLLDNLVWCSDIGIINQTIHALNFKWKNTKDIAACTRATLQVIISVIGAFRILTKQRVYSEQLAQCQAVVKAEGFNCELIGRLLSARREFRFRVIDVIINLLRFFMLWKSLHLPWSRRLSKEFVAICGILSTSFSLFSMLVGEEIVQIQRAPQPQTVIK